AGLSAARVHSRLGGQRVGEVAPAHQGGRSAVALPQRDRALYRPDARRQVAPVQLRHGMQIGHHAAVGRHEARPARLPRDPGLRVVGARARHGRGRPGGRRKELATSEADVAGWNIDIRTTDGRGLPPGRGTVAQGKAVYEAKCVACHGPEAKGGAMYGTMVGGIGSFTTNTRVLTPGSMYPYAPILFD